MQPAWQAGDGQQVDPHHGYFPPAGSPAVFEIGGRSRDDDAGARVADPTRFPQKVFQVRSGEVLPELQANDGPESLRSEGHPQAAGCDFAIAFRLY